MTIGIGSGFGNIVIPTLEEVANLSQYMSAEELSELQKLLAPAPNEVHWSPLPGPQTAAYYSDADILFYGGSAGGGKTDLLLGLALREHRKSIIFRREYPQLKDVMGRAGEIIGDAGSYNGQRNMWTMADGRTLELGAIQNDKALSKYKGRPHDAKLFDELPDFTEYQFRFLTGWLRTPIPGQRTRIVCAGNPPTTVEGEWVIQFFAPWLDSQHPNPAMPGELRWYAVVDGTDVERENGEPFDWKGELIVPKSRTFIPARLDDNPILKATGYGATLQNLPEPLRSQLLHGDFRAGLEDDPWQTIPTNWIRAAQERWRRSPNRPNIPLTALGVDIAYGGSDKTVVVRRYGTWFDMPEVYKGTETPDGPSAAAKFVPILAKEGSYANVDALGYGSSACDWAKSQVGKNAARAIIFGEAAPGRDRTKTLSFANLRAYAYWSLREALDPNNPESEQLALPPLPELLSDLAAPRWGMQARGIVLEDKQEIHKRIGRSPDIGDAVVLAWLTMPVHKTKLVLV